jgi:AcrR family transcriptional regulator
MVDEPETAPGLRARKKERTRDVIVEHALDLFEQRGFDATTVEQIADAANVSPRTVFRYFTSKEDLVFFGQDEENRRLGAMLEKQPKGTDLVDALLQATREMVASDALRPELLVRSERLVVKTPALRAYRLRLLHDAREMLVAHFVSARTSRREALRIRLAVAAYLAATDAAMSAWIAAGAKGTPREELALVEELLKRGHRG